MIVAFEGIDACGKATQSKLLAKKLGTSVISFPAYESYTGEFIKEHFDGMWQVQDNLRRTDERRTAFVRQALMTVNRLELAPLIEDISRNRGHLVLDRYYASGIVYGAVDGLDPAWLALIHCTLPQPDAWILIDVSVDESFKRRPARRDYYERNAEHLSKVRTEYLRMFNRSRRLPHGSAVEGYRKGLVSVDPKWRVIDGHGTVEETHAAVCKALHL